MVPRTRRLSSSSLSLLSSSPTRFFVSCRIVFPEPARRAVTSSCSSIYIVPRASLAASLSPVLYSGSTYFFRDQSPCLSRTSFVAIPPPPPSPPSPTSARLPLQFCSARCFVLPARPLARSSPLAPTLSRIYVRYSGCYKLCHFIGEKHGEKACTSGWRTSVSAARPRSCFYYTGCVDPPSSVADSAYLSDF